MNPRKTRVIIALTMLLLAALPALAQSGGRRYYPEREGAFRIHLGAFQPAGDSEYWTEKEEDFTGSAEDLESAIFGVDYLLPLNNRLSLMFSGSFFEGDTTNSYRDFDDNFGDRIRHDTTLGIASGNIGLVLHLTGPDFALQPYLGAGVGAYAWELEESGDFIDFDDPDLEIFSADLRSEGVTFGYYLQAGLEAPITPHFSIFAEGRWTEVEDDLSDDFEGFGKIDLGGPEVAVGLSWSL